MNKMYSWTANRTKDAWHAILRADLCPVKLLVLGPSGTTDVLVLDAQVEEVDLSRIAVGALLIAQAPVKYSHSTGVL